MRSTPSRMARRISPSVQPPIPVASSGVMLGAQMKPGNPSSRVKQCPPAPSGPALGPPHRLQSRRVWQSKQLRTWTAKYLPRRKRSVVPSMVSADAGRRAGLAVRTHTAAAASATPSAAAVIARALPNRIVVYSVLGIEGRDRISGVMRRRGAAAPFSRLTPERISTCWPRRAVSVPRGLRLLPPQRRRLPPVSRGRRPFQRSDARITAAYMSLSTGSSPDDAGESVIVGEAASPRRPADRRSAPQRLQSRRMWQSKQLKT